MRVQDAIDKMLATLYGRTQISVQQRHDMEAAFHAGAVFMFDMMRAVGEMESEEDAIDEMTRIYEELQVDLKHLIERFPVATPHKKEKK